MAIEDTENAIAIWFEVYMGYVRVLHGAAPPLHAHSHVSDLNSQDMITGFESSFVPKLYI